MNKAVCLPPDYYLVLGQKRSYIKHTESAGTYYLFAKQSDQIFVTLNC